MTTFSEKCTIQNSVSFDIHVGNAFTSTEKGLEAYLNVVRKMAYPCPRLCLPPRIPGSQIKPFLQSEVTPSLILSLSTGVTEEQGEKPGMWLLTKDWITSGKTLGSSESSVSSERLCECEVRYP